MGGDCTHSGPDSDWKATQLQGADSFVCEHDRDLVLDPVDDFAVGRQQAGAQRRDDLRAGNGLHRMPGNFPIERIELGSTERLERRLGDRTAENIEQTLVHVNI